MRYSPFAMTTFKAILLVFLVFVKEGGCCHGSQVPRRDIRRFRPESSGSTGDSGSSSSGTGTKEKDIKEIFADVLGTMERIGSEKLKAELSLSELAGKLGVDEVMLGKLRKHARDVSNVEFLEIVAKVEEREKGLVTDLAMIDTKLKDKTVEEAARMAKDLDSLAEALGFEPERLKTIAMFARNRKEYSVFSEL